ncbi:MAG: lysine-2,3-aminomutase-like protein [Hyphomicrobium aestuarii]|nr:lysine-2,3-aminomutase-like protein [Hyphomicrobium aestuarii]
MNTLKALAKNGLIAVSSTNGLAPVAARYAVAVTPAMGALIARDPDTGRAVLDDPIARQFLPDVRELEHHPAETADPIGDHGKTVAPGVVHRYPDRVLLKLSGVCPVYCRFCFRREMVGPGAGTTLTADEVREAIAYIAATPAIFEVILTGGDPLIVSPRRVREVTQALASIPHVKIIRWHTRVPIVTPERITDEMVAALRPPVHTGGKPVYIAIHSNHPRELTPPARAALARLADAGIPLVSQSVLLAGVNDSADTLEALMRAFLECRVLPYYLHHGDLAPGTSHFRVPIAKGQAIVAELARRMTGLARPAYVLDIPGAHGKVDISHSALTPDGPGRWLVRDPAGHVHRYSDAALSSAGDTTMV